VRVEIEKRALKYINSLPEKDRRIIKIHLFRLEDPYTAPDVELLQNGHCRMHIAHSYTAFFDVMPGGVVKILDVMTIEEAHKRYKRFGT
jgi:mRNA-degrading endonuclease RelE of RelBE toxin-antitoxin system